MKTRIALLKANIRCNNGYYYTPECLMKIAERKPETGKFIYDEVTETLLYEYDSLDYLHHAKSYDPNLLIPPEFSTE